MAFWIRAHDIDPGKPVGTVRATLADLSADCRKLRRDSFLADASVLRALASPAGTRVVFETKVLRPGARVLFELYHDVVAIAFGELRLAHERITFLLELKLLLSVLRVSNDGDVLVSRYDRFSSGIVEVDRNGLVLLDKELRLGSCLFENPSAFRPGFNFFGGSNGEQPGAKNAGQRECE